MKRKTYKVEDLKAHINSILSTSVDSEYINSYSRMALCSLLEKVLMDTGNYKGYWSLRPQEVPVGQKA